MCNERVKPNTPDEMIAVIQAHKEGKTLECCAIGASSRWWDGTFYPTFDFKSYAYRIKREPRKLYSVYSEKTGKRLGTLDSIADAESYRKTWGRGYGEVMAIVEFVENINE